MNNSNTKYLTMGMVPATTLMESDADGFHLEIFLCGDKCSPLPLGGLNGLATLLATIREVPEFSKTIRMMPPSNIQIGSNILISTVTFAEDVSFYF